MDPKEVLTAFRLDGKVALVTGASRGIGRALALGLAGAGANLALAGRERATLEPVAEEIERDLGRQALPVPLDVADQVAIPAAVEAVITRFGRIDILVNNAGINIRNTTLDYTAGEWDTVLDTNLKGTFFLTQ